MHDSEIFVRLGDFLISWADGEPGTDAFVFYFLSDVHEKPIIFTILLNDGEHNFDQDFHTFNILSTVG